MGVVGPAQSPPPASLYLPAPGSSRSQDLGQGSPLVAQGAGHCDIVASCDHHDQELEAPVLPPAAEGKELSSDRSLGSPQLVTLVLAA
eukprot:6189789-Pyramimonas_sp.AAC.1